MDIEQRIRSRTAERVEEIIKADKNAGNLEKSWKSLDLVRGTDWAEIIPKDTTEVKRIYVGTYVYTAKDEGREIEIFRKRKKIIEDLKALHENNSRYIVPVDYASIWEITSDGKSNGYDVLLRYKPRKTLAEYLKVHPGICKEQAELILESLSNAIQEMQVGGRNIVHGHINPEHILIDEIGDDLHFYVSIPGEGRLLQNSQEDRCNTDFYSAPELIADSERAFDTQSDIYSAGLVSYQMLNDGKLPFESETISAEEATIIRCAGDREIPEPKHGSSMLKYIVRKACAYNTVERYSSINEMAKDLAQRNSAVQDKYDPMSVVTLCADIIELKNQEAEACAAEDNVLIQAAEHDEASSPELDGASIPEQHIRFDYISEQEHTNSKDAAIVQTRSLISTKIIVIILAVLLIVLAILVGISVFLLISKSNNNDNLLNYAAQVQLDSSEDELSAETTVTSIATQEELVTTIPVTEPLATEPATTQPLTKTFIVVSEACTWEDAKLRCEEMGGHLAYITCAEDYNEILRQLSSTSLKFIWLGGTTSISSNGNVSATWLNGEGLDYINNNNLWYKNEPSGRDYSDSNMPYEPYIMLWQIDDKWSFNDNSNLVIQYYKDYRIGYICEIDS